MRRSILATLGAIILVVTACGGTDSVDTSAATSTVAVASTTVASTAPAPTTTAVATTAAATTTSPAPTTTTTEPVAHSAAFDAISERGVLHVGTQGGAFLPFADPEGGIGFEPDLAREVALRLFGDIAVEFVPLSGGERFTALQDGTIDLLVRLTTHTTSREQEASPTLAYFLDGLALTLASDSDIASVEDLAGRSIGMNAPNEDYEAQLAAFGIDVVILDDTNAMLDAMDSGTIDGITWSVMSALPDAAARGDRSVFMTVLGTPITMWTAQPDFAAEVDEALADIVGDGTWATIFGDWFGIEPPWSTEEMWSQPAEQS